MFRKLHNISAVICAISTLLLPSCSSDEPTSALDPEMIGEVLDVIRSISHKGITLIIVTHEMAFAKDVADRVIFFQDGDIYEEAPPAEFFGNPQRERTKQFLKRITVH